MVPAAYDWRCRSCRARGSTLANGLDQDTLVSTATDKSLAAHPDDLHRSAFNAAFSELSLKWHWDPDTYRDLVGLPTDKDRIRTYL